MTTTSTPEAPSAIEALQQQLDDINRERASASARADSLRAARPDLLFAARGADPDAAAQARAELQATDTELEQIETQLADLDMMLQTGRQRLDHAVAQDRAAARAHANRRIEALARRNLGHSRKIDGAMALIASEAAAIEAGERQIVRLSARKPESHMPYGPGLFRTRLANALRAALFEVADLGGLPPGCDLGNRDDFRLEVKESGTHRPYLDDAEGES